MRSNRAAHEVSGWRPRLLRARLLTTRNCYFLPPFAAGLAAAAAAGAAPAAGAPSAPAAASAVFSFGAFFLTIFRTRTLGSPYGLRPSVQRSVAISVLIRSSRVSTLRARCSEFFRRRLLSIDMARFAPPAKPPAIHFG